MISGIYRIFNTFNNKIYIGQSINLNRRINRHIFLLNNNRHNNIYLQNSYNKYKEYFKFEIVNKCSIENLDEMEQYFIKVWQTNNRECGYNLDNGGNSNRIFSEETIQKMSTSHIGLQNAKGLIHTEESKLKMSIASKEYHNKKIPRTKEHIEKVRQKNIGLKRSEETKLKLSIARKNRVISKETKAKTSQSLIRRNHPYFF